MLNSANHLALYNQIAKKKTKNKDNLERCETIGISLDMINLTDIFYIDNIHW